MKSVETTFDTSTLLDQAVEDRYFRACFTYPKLLQITVDQLTEQCFSTSVKAKLFSALKLYFQEYKESPSLDILKVTTEVMYPSDQAMLITRLAERIHHLPIPEWKWIVTQIDKYVKTIKLQKASYEASVLLKSGNYNEAQSKLVDVIRHSGIVTSQSSNDLNLTKEELYNLSQDDGVFCCPTRIYALDAILRGFYRKELLIAMAPLNVGKSWFMMHSAVSALMSGKHVLYFTLEMSRERALQRILQNISATVKPRSNDELERDIKIWDEQWANKEDHKARSLLDTNKVAKSLSALKRFGGQLSVKEYSSGVATSRDIERDIELFDVTFGKLPDLVLVDGLMDINFSGIGDKEKARFGLAQLAKDLRRMAKDYNCAMVATHQANRDSMNAELVGVEHTGESFAIMQIADTGISFNQTKAENQLGKMRLNVMRARGSQKFAIIDMWQNLDTAQFCMASKLDNSPAKTATQNPGTKSRRKPDES